MNPEPLEYGQRHRLIARIGHRRIVSFAVVVAVTVAALLWTKPAIRRAQQWNREQQFLRTQRHAMRYTAPADRVVYEEDPERAAKLLNGDDDVREIPVLDSGTSGPAMRPTFQPPVMRVPTVWRSYWPLGNPAAASQTPGAAFLHERATRAGKAHLVCVAVRARLYHTAAGGWEMVRELEASAIPVGQLTTPTSPSGPRRGQLAIFDRERGLLALSGLFPDPRMPHMLGPFPMRLYAGQPDPLNSAGFTIRYELGGYRGVINGMLNEDGSVSLTPDIERISRYDNDTAWLPRVPEPERTRATTHP